MSVKFSGEKYSIAVATRLTRLPPYLFGRINDIKYQRRQAGIDIIDLGMGNPSDPTPQPIVDKLCQAAGDARNQRYSASRGIYNLRREYAIFYEKTFGVTCDPETEVLCCLGSKEGFSHLCLAMMGPGDTALVPTPFFPIHVYSVMLAGANVISIPLQDDDDRFLSNLSAIAGSLTPRPKMLILNFPHNPTAKVVTLDFYREVVKLARKHKFFVISDFAYGLTVFDDYQAPSFLQVPGAKKVGVEFTTMSKPFNMAGWRLGYCVGNPQMVKALAQIKGYYDYGVFQPIQIAAIVGLRHCRKEIRKQAKLYEERRDTLVDGLNRQGWQIEKPKASMFVWAPIPEPFRKMGSIDFTIFLLEKAEVAVAPGAGFGEQGEGYVRLALVENELRLKQAIRQIGRAMRKGP